MLKKILLVLLIATTGFPSITSAQQAASDAVAILGEWNISSVQTEVYSQKEGTLLEKKSIDPRVEGSQAKMGIPMGIRFTPDSCFIRGKEAIAGSYDIVPSGLIRVRQVINPRLPAITKTYQYLLIPGLLTVTLPSVYYQDAGRNEAVKVIYQCQYKRD